MDVYNKKERLTDAENSWWPVGRGRGKGKLGGRKTYKLPFRKPISNSGGPSNTGNRANLLE